MVRIPSLRRACLHLDQAAHRHVVIHAPSRPRTRLETTTWSTSPQTQGAGHRPLPGYSDVDRLGMSTRPIVTEHSGLLVPTERHGLRPMTAGRRSSDADTWPRERVHVPLAATDEGSCDHKPVVMTPSLAQDADG